MEAKKDRPDPYLAGHADGEAGKPMDAASWLVVAAEWHVGKASKWGKQAWRHEARVYCPHCGHVALNSLAAEQRLQEGYRDVVCGVCDKRFRVDVQIRREYSSVPTND